MPYDLDAPDSREVAVMTSVDIAQYRIKEIGIVFSDADLAYRVVLAKGIEFEGVFTEHEVEEILLTDADANLAAELAAAPVDATVQEVILCHIWRAFEASGLIPAGVGS